MERHEQDRRPTFAATVGDWQTPPRAIWAQTIRVILLSNATRSSIGNLRVSMVPSQMPGRDGLNQRSVGSQAISGAAIALGAQHAPSATVSPRVQLRPQWRRTCEASSSGRYCAGSIIRPNPARAATVGQEYRQATGDAGRLRDPAARSGRAAGGIGKVAHGGTLGTDAGTGPAGPSLPWPAEAGLGGLSGSGPARAATYRIGWGRSRG